MATTPQKRFKNNPVWAELELLEEHLADAVRDGLAAKTPEVASTHASLVAVAKYSRRVLRSVNPVLVRESQLDAVTSAIKAVYNSVGAAVSQNSEAQLSTAWTQADQLFATLSVLPSVRSSHDTSEMAEAVDHFHQQVSEMLEELETRSGGIRTEVQTLESSVSNLTSEISGQKGLLATAISDFSTRFASDQETRAAEYTAAIETNKKGLQEAIDQAETYYADDEERHKTQMKEFQDAFDALQAERGRISKELDKAQAIRAEAVLGDLEIHLEKAKGLVGMIGEVTMKGHYRDNAEEQKTDADKWRMWTVIASGVTAGLAIAAAMFGIFGPVEQDWADHVRFIGVTIALGALSAFLASQSLAHRRREVNYRALELELATLDPFLSSLSEDERDRIKAELALKYFRGIYPEPVNSKRSSAVASE